MALRRRHLLASLVVSLPMALLLMAGLEARRQRDLTEALERVVLGMMTDDAREDCTNYAQWFLAGPRERKPTPAERALPDSDVNLPRPSADPLPFEFYAYDGELIGQSTAAPRLPDEMKRALRAGATRITLPFPTAHGTGVQTAVSTGWRGSPCAVLLARLRPAPGRNTWRIAQAFVLWLALAGVAWVVGAPTLRRIRKSASLVHRSAAGGYTEIVDVPGKDELSTLALTFNEAGAAIRQRQSDVREHEEQTRRFIARATGDTSPPLEDLQARLEEIERETGLPPSLRDQVRAAVRDAHDVSFRLGNLVAAAKLKVGDPPAVEDVDLRTLTRDAATRLQALARASGVALEPPAAGSPLTVRTNHALLQQVVTNLIDHALGRTLAQGRVVVSLDVDQKTGRFIMRVTDTGPAVSDEELSLLSAVRRFRGDEGRTGLRGDLDVGIAVAREAADRLGLQWAFRRPWSGGFESEISGPIGPRG